MLYTARPVLLEAPTVSVYQHAGGRTGFPAGAFNYLLFSEWVCLGGGGPRTVGIFNPSTFVSVVFSSASVQVIINAGFNNVVFDGTYAVAVGAQYSNLLVSAAPATQTIQVYVNDAPLTRTSGGWTGSGAFNISTSANQWDINGSGSPGLGDLFIAAPAAFYDLSVDANRRRFITHGKAPVDLGVDASGVLGTVPPIYLTARPESAANSFATNYGTGGAFSIGGSGSLAFQVPGTCFVPSSLAMDNLLAFAAVKTSNLVFLEWSDDRGHSYGNPVSQPIGDRGEYLTSASWNRLGYARDRVFRITWSVPVATALQGAWITLDASPKS